jgi:hypothetical protein
MFLAKLFDNEWFLMTVIVAVIIGSMVTKCAAPAEASTFLPPAQFTPRTRVWLARAMVSEAGWKAELDHAGISHILYRRWKNMRKRWPDMTFEHVIRAYCAGFYVKERSLTPRQRWIQQLIPSPRQPKDWPAKKASWKVHMPLWKAAWDRAGRFGAGKLRDPCRGRAWHWGGEIDLPLAKQKRLVEVDCGNTRNTFYTLPKPGDQEEYADRDEGPRESDG